jgi:plastocyanin
MGKILISSFAVLALAVAPASADFVNGGFETNDFTSWSTLGLASVESAAFGSGTPEGSYQAFLDTYDMTGASDSDIESFLDLGVGQLDAIADSLNTGDNVIEGSAMMQTITVNAGDVLQFEWNMLTDEFTAQEVFNDFSFVSIVDSMTDVSVLADVFNGSFQSSNTMFANETGFSTFSYTFATAGTYTVGFGVVDVGTEDYASGLIVDNIRIVPAPGAAVLAVIGMPMIAWIRRRVA